MRRAVVLLLATCTCVAASCGSRVPTTPVAAGPSTVAPASSTTTTKVLGATSTTVKPGASTTTVKGPASTTTTAKAATTTTGAPTTVAADSKAELCKAAKVYAIDDMLSLGDHILADPDGLLAAYNAILANAPPDLLADITAMGPLTKTAVAAKKNGEFTDSAGLQQWLVNAPRADLEGWVKSQQVVAPALKDRCA